MGCDTYSFSNNRGDFGFNPRTRMGCDLLWVWFFKSLKFQSTHPHGVRLAIEVFSRALRCFNPRTRMGCDLADLAVKQRGQVSIHAPAWGATCTDMDFSSHSRFQSTHPHGVRLKYAKKKYGKDAVSIHAPAWGATVGNSRGTPQTNCFNPRTRMGCDVACVLFFVFIFVSIHAPAWGATY